jgi:hypothetical protein
MARRAEGHRVDFGSDAFDEPIIHGWRLHDYNPTKKLLVAKEMGVMPVKQLKSHAPG